MVGRIGERPLIAGLTLSRSKIGYGWLTCRSSVRQAACVYSLIRPLRDRFPADLLCADVGHGGAGSDTFVVWGARWAMPWCGGAVL